MNWKYRKTTAIMLVFAILIGQVGIRPLHAAVTPDRNTDDYLARFRKLIESGDVRLDSDAFNGTPANVLQNPENFEAGLVLGGVGEALIVIGLVLFWWESQKIQVSDDDLRTKLARLFVAASGMPTMEVIDSEDLESRQPVLFSDEDIAAAKQLAKDVATVASYVQSLGDTWIVFKTLNEIIVFNIGDWLLTGSGNELINGGSLASSNDVYYWSDRQGAIAGLSSFGPIGVPQNSDGGRFGLIHTGLGSVSNEGRMQQAFFSPSNASATFTARYNFVTTEFPEWLGSVYNDSFFIDLLHVQSGATKELVRFEGSLNQLFSESDINTWRHVQFSGGLPVQILDMAGTGAGQTGWITVSRGGIYLQKGQQYIVRLRVNDVTDAIWDSALLVDKVSLR